MEEGEPAVTDTIDHIICGGAGNVINDCKTIMIHDHEVLNVAVNLKHEALAAHYESQGLNEARAHRKALRVGKRIQRFWDDLYADLEDDGLPSFTYDPNPANLG
jgi:hypothetical protein